MTGQPRPLVLTADNELLDDLLGSAAAVGLAVDVAVEAAACRRQWAGAPLVIVGGDLAPTLPEAGLSWRREVVLVTRGSPCDEAWASAARLGAEDVISLPTGEAALLERLADVAEPAGAARVIGVIPGRGGAGSSVLAAAVALAAGGDGAAWLVDLDPLGGGADAGLGAELSPGARWTDLGEVSGRVSARALRDALPEISGVALLSVDGRSVTGPAPAAVRAVLSAARRGGGTVVLDLPRQGTEAREQALAAADEVILVVPAEVRAVLAARQLLCRLPATPAAVQAIVRNVPGGLPAHEVAGSLGLSLRGDLDDEPAVRAALLSGDPTGLVRGTRLGALCRQLLNAPIGGRRVA